MRSATRRSKGRLLLEERRNPSPASPLRHRIPQLPLGSLETKARTTLWSLLVLKTRVSDRRMRHPALRPRRSRSGPLRYPLRPRREASTCHRHQLSPEMDPTLRWPPREGSRHPRHHLLMAHRSNQVNVHVPVLATLALGMCLNLLQAAVRCPLFSSCTAFHLVGRV